MTLPDTVLTNEKEWETSHPVTEGNAPPNVADTFLIVSPGSFELCFSLFHFIFVNSYNSLYISVQISLFDL